MGTTVAALLKRADTLPVDDATQEALRTGAEYGHVLERTSADQPDDVHSR